MLIYFYIKLIKVFFLGSESDSYLGTEGVQLCEEFIQVNIGFLQSTRKILLITQPKKLITNPKRALFSIVNGVDNLFSRLSGEPFGTL